MIETGTHTGKGFKLQDNFVLMPHWIQDAYIYAKTDNFLAADLAYYDGPNICHYKLHFFIEIDGTVRETSWEELNDDLRLLVRVDGREKIEAYNCSPGEYEDDRYNILEGLEAG